MKLHAEVKNQITHLININIKVIINVNIHAISGCFSVSINV